MALVKRFDMELNKLFYRRTSWLKAAIGKKLPGRPHEFNRKQVYPMLDKLGEIAAAILVKRRARGEFSKIRDVKRQWQVKRGKGHGVDAKQESFKRWYKKHIGSKNCVYVFWARRRCVYVGRTLHGHGRPAGWFDRVWFQPVTRIDIYSISNPSRVPKAECLAMHLFDPAENDYWPSIGKYTKKCTICSATKEIEQELKSIFRLR